MLSVTPFDQELVQAVQRMDGVAEAEGRQTVSIRLKTGTDEAQDEEALWRTLKLDALDDYDDIRLNQMTPVAGAWPPPKRGVLIERASLPLMQVEVGDTVVVETPDGRQRRLHIAGLVHDLSKPPAQFKGTPYGYITFDTLEWLGFSQGFNELRILVAENGTDKGHIQAVADRVQDKIEKSGRIVHKIEIPEPGTHPANEEAQTLLVILGLLGTFSLFLSSFLVINTMSALLTQQVRQVGVMKAIGARTGQIMQMYLGATLIFGLLSLVVAVPLGGVIAYILTVYIAGLLNFDLPGFRLPLEALAFEVAVGLIMPLLAALYPVYAGTRITVREAISADGLGKESFGRNLIDRAVGAVTSRVQLLSRPIRLSLRNTFRRKARLALTLTTLVLGGAVFIAVLSVHASVLNTLDNALGYFNYDIQVDFARPYRLAEIEREALLAPGVVEAESWNSATARRLRPDGREGTDIFIIAPPANTNLIRPTLLQGRWLLPNDENAIVLNSDVLEEEPDIGLGDEVVLKIEERETNWRVVGIVKGVMIGSLGYANQPYFARVIREVGCAGSVLVVTRSPMDTAQPDPAFQLAVANKLKDHFDSRGLQVSSTEILASVRQKVESQFNIVVIFLAMMAVLVAAVGSLGLMGTMSINVLERTREIGVMRAIGASDGSVLKIFMVEGIFIGGLSWLIGTIVALPVSKLLSNAVGMAFVDTPLSYTFSATGALLWLGIALTLAAMASFLPAWHASRLTVREVLAYE